MIVLLAVGNLERADDTRAIFAAIALSAEADLPWHCGLYDITEDRSQLVPEEGESRHGLRLWLKLLVEHFFIPLQYNLSGEVFWTASEDIEDRGGIFVKDNQVEIVDDVIFNAGPSWAPNHYVDQVLKQAIQSLLDFADDAGCSQI